MGCAVRLAVGGGSSSGSIDVVRSRIVAVAASGKNCASYDFRTGSRAGQTCGGYAKRIFVRRLGIAAIVPGWRMQSRWRLGRLHGREGDGGSHEVCFDGVLTAGAFRVCGAWKGVVRWAWVLPHPRPLSRRERGGGRFVLSVPGACYTVEMRFNVRFLLLVATPYAAACGCFLGIKLSDLSLSTRLLMLLAFSFLLIFVGLICFACWKSREPHSTADVSPASRTDAV
jgi:hypothetical protein